MIETLDRPAAGPVIRLHEADNVVIARANVEIGAKLGAGLTCRSQVPSGHKIATRSIRKGEPILKYNVMAGYALHANLAGALIVGLGCERNQVSKLFKEQGLESSSRLRSFVMQDEGGTTKTIAACVAAVKEMLPEANRVTRTSVPASHITV